MANAFFSRTINIEVFNFVKASVTKVGDFVVRRQAREVLDEERKKRGRRT